MRDNINLQCNTSSLSKPCESCGQFGHTFNGCPMIQFHSNKHKQIFNYNQLKQLTRQPHKRREETFTTLQLQREVQDSIQGFHEHIYYTQQQKEENEKKQFKNFSTIDDDDDQYSVSEDQNKKNEGQDLNQIDQQDTDSRNQLVNLAGLEDQSFVDDNLKLSKNNSLNAGNLPSGQIQQTKKQIKNVKLMTKGSSIFARELHQQQIKSEENSEEESEIHDINNPDSPEQKSNHSSAKKQVAIHKENNNLSNFFQYSNRESEKEKVDLKIEKINLGLIKEESTKYQDRTKAIKLTEDVNHIQNGSQKTIGGILKDKLFSIKKNDELRRKSRYISATMLHKQFSIQLSDVNSPDKRGGIFSPTNSKGIPSMHQTGAFNYASRTPTMTPSARRGTLRHQSQLSSSMQQMVNNMCDQAAKKENLIKSEFSCQQEVELDFDFGKDYEIYFVHNNPSTVIDKTNKFNYNNKICQDFLKEKSLRRKKKGTQKQTRYEKKNFNLLNKKQTQKNPQQVSQSNKMSIDWTKQEDIEKLPDINKQEFDNLILKEEQNL